MAAFWALFSCWSCRWQRQSTLTKVDLTPHDIQSVLNFLQLLFSILDSLAEGFDKGLNYTMSHYGAGNGLKSADFDAMQTQLHCCGSHGYEDWAKLNTPVPRSCCRIDVDCDVQDEIQIWRTGCYSIVVKFIDENMKVIAAAALGVAFFPVLGMVLSCCLARNINKAKYEQMA